MGAFMESIVTMRCPEHGLWLKLGTNPEGDPACKYCGKPLTVVYPPEAPPIVHIRRGGM